MRKFKVFLGLVIIIFAALIVYQNRAYFFTKQALSLSLGVETWHWTAPPVENVYYFGAFLLIGLLITGFMGISSKLKSRKTIKSLNATIEAHLEMISSLKTELETYKSDPYLKKAAEGEDLEAEPEAEAIPAAENTPDTKADKETE